MEWLSTNWQFLVLLTTLGTGFRWILSRFDKIEEKLNDLDKRLTIVETILQMMGYPIKPKDKND